MNGRIGTVFRNANGHRGGKAGRKQVAGRLHHQQATTEITPSTKPSHYQMRMALLEVAEDPDRPGTIDVQRLERFLLNLQAKGVIDGRKLVSSQDANGERRWWAGRSAIEISSNAYQTIPLLAMLCGSFFLPSDHSTVTSRG